MDIYGLQKMTLIDYPGKVACTVFMGGCDFRCPFCHNWELSDGSWPPVMDDSELLAFLKKRRGLLDGVCVTGGEPLLQRNLADLLRRIKDLGFPVKLDTNGSHPDRLAVLLKEGLIDYTAMDVKNSPERYARTIGLPFFDLTPVRESVNLLMSGDADYEFRTTAAHPLHDSESFVKIADWLAGAKRYFIQRYTERDTVPDKSLSTPSVEDLAHYAEIVRKKIPSAAIRGV